MAHSSEWARQLLHELPNDPEDLLPSTGRRRNYADPTFLGLFFDWLDERIYHDPQSGLRWAKVAPELAKATPEEGPDADRLQRENLVKAHSILAGAYRATSQHDASEEQYGTALQIAKSEAIAPEAHADLYQRLAVLRACQARQVEALELLARALDIYPSEPCLNRSRVLVRRSFVLNDLGRFSESIECLGEALRGIRPEVSNAAARAHQCAAQNLAVAISKCRHAPPWNALEHVRDAKRLLDGQRRSMPRHRLQWVEGLVLRRLEACGARPGYSLAERAERAFQRARDGFIQLRAPWEIALVGLDLAALYRSLSRWDDLFAIAFDTLQRFRELSGNTQAVAALSLCVDAARGRAGVVAAIAAAQEIVANRAAKSPSPAKANRSRRKLRTAQPPRSTRASRTSPKSAKPRQRRTANQTREALLQATFDEIHRNGFGSTKHVRRILSTAGVTRGALKHHFGDAQGLGVAVVDELARDRLMAEWVRPLDEADDPLDAIAAAFRNALDDTVRGPLNNLARNLDPAPSSEEEEAKTTDDRIAELYDLWHQTLVRGLARGQRQGTVCRDLDPGEVAATVIAFYEGLNELARGSKGSHLAEMCVSGIVRHLDSLRPSSGSPT